MAVTTPSPMMDDVAVHPYKDLSCIVPLLPVTVYTFTVNHDTGASSFPYVSDYAEKMFHIPAKDLEADPESFTNLVHKDDVENFTKSVLDSMQNLTPWDHQMRMHTKSGSFIHVYGKSVPHTVEEINADGTVTKLTVWHGVLIDNTDKKKNEDAAKASLKDLLESTVEPLFAVDCDGFLTEWNDPMAEITGYDRESVVNKTFTSFVSENQKHAVASMFSNSIGAGGTHSHDIRLLSKDGHDVYIHVTYKRWKDVNGTVVGVYGSCQDVTMLKEAEKEKNVALKLADAEKSLTEWLSHEIRNPLSVAMEAAQVLKDKQDTVLSTGLVDEEGASYLDMISRSIVYVVELLTNMLDLNKCVEGKIILRPRLCSIREDILIPMQQMMGVWSHTGRIPVHVLGDEVQVYADTLRLKQVITNLLSNAIKYTTVGFINLSVEIKKGENETQMNESVIITVSDSGSGVSKLEYDNLFLKWEQLGSSVNGAGIGLCLCRMLVMAMGGEIDLNLEYFSGIEGHPGAQFMVTLPINSLSSEGKRTTSTNKAFDAVSDAVVRHNGSKVVEVPANMPILNTNTGIPYDACIRGSYRILIVDDDQVGRKLFRRRFSRIFPDGCIDEVESGEEAIEKVTKEGIIYDAIFMDHFMAVKKMNGAETIRELRKHNVDSLIIGVSGNSKDNEHVSAGANSFFQKPLPPDDILLHAFLARLPPPNGWNVLVVDDVKVNSRFLRRKLQKASSAHFTNMDMAQKHWFISTCTTGQEAMDLIQNQYFDLLVLDQNLGDDTIRGTDIAEFARECGVNKNSITVLNSGSDFKQTEEASEPFDLYWPKPLPSVEQMRRNLCRKLVQSRASIVEGGKEEKTAT